MLRVTPFYFEGQRHFSQRGLLLHSDTFEYRSRKESAVLPLWLEHVLQLYFEWDTALRYAGEVY